MPSRLTLLACLATAMAVGTGTGQAQTHGHPPGMAHDEVGMPGLRGLDTLPHETQEMMVMFHHFPDIWRTVEVLPDGIRTETGSGNPMVMDALASHVAGMITRVEEGRDPQVFIQSPTLDIFFQRRESLRTEIELTEGSIIVTQKSDDPELVAALHLHAAEVTDMAERGMQAVHEMMEARGQ
jgi:hypothetical protein